MDLDQLILNKNSHSIFNVSCDFQVSNKCRKNYKMELRQYIKLTTNNNGKLPCIYCSRTIKFSNRNNPNVKYKNINDLYFSKIDNINKAYLLGWIASDGHIGKRGFKIAIHQKDIEILKIFQMLVCKEVPIRLFTGTYSPMCSYEINSKRISQDLCKLLSISPGKKSNSVCFPKIDTNYELDFIRGYFEGDGSINDKDISKFPYAKGNIRSNSNKMLESIQKILGGCIACNMLCFSNKRCMKILDAIYQNDNNLKLNRKYKRYLKWKENEMPKEARADLEAPICQKRNDNEKN